MMNVWMNLFPSCSWLPIIYYEMIIIYKVQVPLKADTILILQYHIRISNHPHPCHHNTVWWHTPYHTPISTSTAINVQVVTGNDSAIPVWQSLRQSWSLWSFHVRHKFLVRRWQTSCVIIHSHHRCIEMRAAITAAINTKLHNHSLLQLSSWLP